MSISKILSHIVQGKLDFCCLCLGQAGENEVYIGDELFIDSCDSLTMSDVLIAIFGESLGSISTSGVVCNQCSAAAVNCYRFITTSKANLSTLDSAIDSFQESLKNVPLEELKEYNTLYVTVDVEEFTTKQFYDNEIVHNTAKACKRINKIVNTQVEVDPSLKGIFFNKINIPNKTRVKKSETRRYFVCHTRDMLANENKPTDFTCKNCLKTFMKEDHLRRHFLRYCSRKIKCSKCHKRFTAKERLYAHEQKVHATGVCKVCGKYFTNIHILKRHEENHDFQATCEDCGRTYRSMEALRKHFTDNICKQKTKKSVQQAIFECDYCHKRYCYKPYLSKHIMHEHGNKEGFRCTFCNKNFYTPSRLRTHLVKHTKDKKYSCKLCEKLFVTRESLLYHTRLHTGEKPYACEFCKQSFLNASRRLEHVRKHHLPPSLVCTICDAKFRSTNSLLKHKKAHSKSVNKNIETNIRDS